MNGLTVTLNPACVRLPRTGRSIISLLLPHDLLTPSSPDPVTLAGTRLPLR